MTWPTDWADEIRAHYAQLAEEWGWDPDIVAAVTASAEHIRDLASQDRPRRYFAGDFDNEQYYFETVEDCGSLVVLRQIVVGRDGHTHRYWWGRIEDGFGGLSESAIDPREGPPASGAEVFARAWQF